MRVPRPAATVGRDVGALGAVTLLGVGTATTAHDGSFVLPDVEPPYTVHVRHPTVTVLLINGPPAHATTRS